MSSETPHLRSDTPSALPAGTRLAEFELLRLLGVGGFGIVYLAFDHALEREVAVKEYMPASLAGRTETMHVSLRSQSDAETFALGLKSFVNEARLLARFDHPSLLKVLRFWEANGTAYMAMPVMRGRTVKEVRLEMSSPPDEAWLRAMLEPLLGAIEKLHSEGVYHRDIAPDNIQIEPDGHPVLLDFGAARRVISDKSQTLTAILKPAYAPIEQYAEVGSVKQGPWTDIYALGATLHFLLLARPPAPATARAVHDDASALTTDALPGCSENFLRIVDWMLAPRPADRPQSVAALRDSLDGRTQPSLRRALPPAEASQWDRTVVLAPAPPPAEVEISLDLDDDATVVVPKSRGTAPPGAGTTTVKPPRPEVPSPLPAPMEPSFAAPPVAGSLSAPAAPAGRSRILPVGLGLGALAVAAAAVMWWPRQPTPSVAVEPPASVAALPVPVPVPAAPAALPASAVPESAVATVVVKPAAPAPKPVVSVADSATALGPATKPGGDRPAGGATRPAGGNAHPATAQTPALTAATSSDQQKPAPEAQTQSPAPVPTQAPVAAGVVEPPKPVAAGPEAKCGGRNPVMYFVCMERECLRSEFTSHADCQKWRKNARHE